MPILHVVAAGITAGVAWSAGASAFEKHIADRINPYLGIVLAIGLGYVLLRKRE